MVQFLALQYSVILLSSGACWLTGSAQQSVVVMRSKGHLIGFIEQYRR